MQKKNMFVAVALIAPLLAGCAAETPIAGPSQSGAESPISGASLSHVGGPVAASGGGEFIVQGLDAKFAFNAVQRDASGAATGHLRFSLEQNGLLVEFHGKVTCLTTDPVNNRAWVGGVVTQNKSEHPGFQTAIHEVGRDIWFRVADGGEGANMTGSDRASFVGFEGALNVITSADYCALQLWPNNANEVTKGNVQVR